ncbi:hypothetical protein BJ170DRAFT_24559 [Xylariales sp. AK1849]|nr:hypothetical protein BJ170DRAFT_24559 [Xylariales sp. AK1849]
MATGDATDATFEGVQKHFMDLVKDAGSSGMRIQYDNQGVKYWDNYPFLREGVASKILTRDALQTEVFGRVVHPGRDEEEGFLCRILDSPGLHIILLIILSMGNLEMLKNFLLKFLKGKDTHEKSDQDLPLEEDVAEQIFGKSGRLFFKIQFAFVAVTITEGRFRDEYQYLRCLPYLEQTEIGKGAYGRVYKVKIERGHFKFRQPNSRNKDALFLARKDFKPDEESYEAFKSEDLILKGFMNSSTCPTSIMTSMGSLVQTIKAPEVRYPSSSIFFPPAMCNLSQYIRDDENFPRSSYTARLHHMKQMLSIGQGLEWLSRNLVYVPSDDQYVYTTYYHCDLKPDNILVCKDPYRGPRSVLFKIADFGKARGLQRTPKDTKNRRKEFLRSLPASGRDFAYLAPEVQDTKAKPEVKAKSDVWAFGCIFLELILFNYEGKASITHFQTSRTQKSLPCNRGDWFSQENRSGTDIRNPAVTERLKKLIDITDTRQHKEVDGKFALESLKYLRDYILVPHKSRHAISVVTQSLHGFYNERSRLKALRVRYNEVSKSAKHCSTSPGGLVVFFSPEKIGVYSEGPNTICEFPPSSREQQWSDTTRPTSKACARETLCVVSDTEEPMFECTIHNINGNTTERRHIQLRSVQKSETPVESVALSPDGQSLAIACKLSGNCARVQLYHVDDLGQVKTGTSSSTDTSIGNSSLQPTQVTVLSSGTDRLRDSKDLTGVKYNVDLCFSRNGSTLYHAMRRNGDTPRIEVTAWRTTLMGSRIAGCVINDIDTSLPGSFLTSIVPFNKQVGFLCIMHNRSIMKQTLHGNYFTPDTIQMRSLARLQSVLISANDEKIIILAVSDKSYLEIWGAFINSLEAPRKLDIADEIAYNPDTDCACILEDGGSMRLLVTNFKRRETLRFDLERLFTHQDADGYS